MGESMQTAVRASSYLVGDQALLIHCAEVMLERRHAVRAVITSDAGVARWASDRGLPVLERGPELADRMRKEPFDWLLSVGNPEPLGDDVLALPRRGAIHLHDAPLAAYAGAHCPSWALFHRRPTHGVTWHLLRSGGGPAEVLVERPFDVGEGDTALTLHTRCFDAATESFPELLQQLESGELQPRTLDLTEQLQVAAHDRPTPGCLLLWDGSAALGAALVRALDFGTYPNPLGTPKLWSRGRSVLARRAEAVAEEVAAAPGTVVAVDADAMSVATAEGVLRLSGFCSTDGEPLEPEAAARALGVVSGDRLAAPDGESLACLADMDARAARDEALWLQCLRAERAVVLPGVDAFAPAGQARELPLDLPDGFDVEAAVALFGAWVARLGSPGELHASPCLWWRSESWAAPMRALTALFAPAVPIAAPVAAKATLEAAAAEVATIRAALPSRGPLARDLYLRHPGLSAPRLDAGVHLLDGDGPPPAAEALAPVVLRAGGGAPPALVVDSGRVSDTVADAMRAQLEVMARHAAHHPSCPVERLPLLSDDDRRRVLEQWNDTARPLPDERRVHGQIAEQVARAPEAVALIAGPEVLTYGELDLRANRLARHLQSLGVGPDVLVGVCLPRTADLVVAVLAIHKAGGAYLPLDPTYPPERLAFMLEDSGARVVVTHAALAQGLGDKAAAVVCLDAEAAALTAVDASPVVSDVAPSHLAYVIYTSGSTGTPKGVMVEHAQVTHFFAAMDERIPRAGDGTDTWLAVTSLSFDISVLELLWTLARGFRVVLAADGDRLRSSGAGTGVRRRPVSFSLFYFASDEGAGGAAKYELLLEGAKFADRQGFEAVWTPERHFHAFGGLYPNPAVTGAALAVLTERVKIRAGSCVLPLHHPARVAEEWALVDNLSSGRVGVSFAAGWQPNDFVLRPESFEDPKAAMLRDLDTVRRLWRGETVELEGPRGPVPVRTLPRPVQREIPVWLTAAGNPSTFEAAGQAGAGLLTHLLGQSLGELGDKIAAYRRAWRDAGHAGRGHVTLMLHTFVGPDGAAVKEQVRAPMKAYLASSLGLIKQHAWAFPAFKRHAKEGVSFEDNFQSLSADDTDALLEHSFERYYETSGLFGTPAQALSVVERAQEAGVDEVACLIDFGIDPRVVLEHLPHLDAVRELAAQASASDGDSLSSLVERHGVTHLQCTPSLARMLALDEGAWPALSRLRHLLIGGEALPGPLVAELRRATRASITNMYGPTETTVWSATHEAEPCAGTVPIGRPIANTRLYVLDGQREPLPVGSPGELWIGGEGVARGYLGREALTAERFMPDPFAGGSARMYRTGDVVRYRPDGVLEFLGRTDHQVKLRGHRIEPGEVEARLCEHPAVSEAAVLVREDVPGDARLVAYVVGRAADAAGLREHLRSRLPEPMVPSQVVVLERMPLTPNGKVDRKALPAPRGGARSGQPTGRMPRGETQEKLAALWCRLLGLEQVGTEDNFFDLGGHSLLAVQVHREIREALGCELTVTDVFRFPTITALAAHLEGVHAGFDGSAERGAARRAALLRRRGVRHGGAGGAT
jgi:natural product biosynthesis luciferase-like monooxygenase protein